MIFKVMDAPAVPGGKALVMCHDDGTVVDGQIGAALDQEIGERVVVAVKFSIDGKKVRLVGE